MKLSRAKIARLLKTGNQSRKNKKNRERRSKSLHIANDSTSIFKDDELILLPTPTANMQSIMTSSKANRRARSANNKRKTLNLRFKTMKHRKQKGKQSGGKQSGGMQSGGDNKIFVNDKTQLTDDTLQIPSYKPDYDNISTFLLTLQNDDLITLFKKYVSPNIEANYFTDMTHIDKADSKLSNIATAIGSGWGTKFKETVPEPEPVTGSEPVLETEEEKIMRNPEYAEYSRNKASSVDSGESTSSSSGESTSGESPPSLEVSAAVVPPKADEPPAGPSTLTITIVSKETDTLELVEGVTAANKPTPKNTEKPLEPQLTVDSTIEDLLKAIAALPAFQGVDDSPSRPWYKPDTDQIFYNNETDDIGKHTSTEKLSVTFKAAKPDDVISLRIVAKTIKITVLGPDGKKTTVSDKDFKVDDPLNTNITGISGLKSCIDIDLTTGKKNDTGVAFDANKHAVTDQNGNILDLEKSFKDNDIEADATLTIRTHVYIFFQRLLYGDLYFYVDVQYIRNVFNYLTSESNEYRDLIQLQPFPADTKSEEEQEKLEQNKALWAQAAKETSGGALELEGGAEAVTLEGGAKKGAEDGSNAVDTSAVGGSEAEQMGGEIVQTGGAWQTGGEIVQTGGAWTQPAERDKDTEYVGFPVPELTPRKVKTDYKKFILALIGNEKTIFPELYFGEGKGDKMDKIDYPKLKAAYEKYKIKVVPALTQVEKLTKYINEIKANYKENQAILQQQIATANAEKKAALEKYNTTYEESNKTVEGLKKTIELLRKGLENATANAEKLKLKETENKEATKKIIANEIAQPQLDIIKLKSEIEILKANIEKLKQNNQALDDDIAAKTNVMIDEISKLSLEAGKAALLLDTVNEENKVLKQSLKEMTGKGEALNEEENALNEEAELDKKTEIEKLEQKIKELENSEANTSSLNPSSSQAEEYTTGFDNDKSEKLAKLNAKLAELKANGGKSENTWSGTGGGDKDKFLDLFKNVNTPAEKIEAAYNLLISRFDVEKAEKGIMELYEELFNKNKARLEAFKGKITADTAPEFNKMYEEIIKGTKSDDFFGEDSGKQIIKAATNKKQENTEGKAMVANLLSNTQRIYLTNLSPEEKVKVLKRWLTEATDPKEIQKYKTVLGYYENKYGDVGAAFTSENKHIAALEEARGYWREFITGTGTKVFTKEEPTDDLVQKLKMKYYLNFIAYVYLDAQKVSEMAVMLENKNILKKINAYFQDIDAASFTDSLGNIPPKGAVSKFFAGLRVNFRINSVSQSDANNLEENKQHMAGLVEVFSKNHKKLVKYSSNRRNAILFKLGDVVNSGSFIKEQLKALEKFFSYVRCKEFIPESKELSDMRSVPDLKDAKLYDNIVVNFYEEYKAVYMNQPVNNIYKKLNQTTGKTAKEKFLKLFLDWQRFSSRTKNIDIIKNILAVETRIILPLAKDYKRTQLAAMAGPRLAGPSASNVQNEREAAAQNIANLAADIFENAKRHAAGVPPGVPPPNDGKKGGSKKSTRNKKKKRKGTRTLLRKTSGGDKGDTDEIKIDLDKITAELQKSRTILEGTPPDRAIKALLRDITGSVGIIDGLVSAPGVVASETVPITASSETSASGTAASGTEPVVAEPVVTVSETAVVTDATADKAKELADAAKAAEIARKANEKAAAAKATARDRAVLGLGGGGPAEDPAIILAEATKLKAKSAELLSLIKKSRPGAQGNFGQSYGMGGLPDAGLMGQIRALQVQVDALTAAQRAADEDENTAAIRAIMNGEDSENLKMKFLLDIPKNMYFKQMGTANMGVENWAKGSASSILAAKSDELYKQASAKYAEYLELKAKHHNDIMTLNSIPPEKLAELEKEITEGGVKIISANKAFQDILEKIKGLEKQSPGAEDKEKKGGQGGGAGDDPPVTDPPTNLPAAPVLDSTATGPSTNLPATVPATNLPADAPVPAPVPAPVLDPTAPLDPAAPLDPDTNLPADAPKAETLEELQARHAKTPIPSAELQALIEKSQNVINTMNTISPPGEDATGNPAAEEANKSRTNAQAKIDWIKTQLTPVNEGPAAAQSGENPPADAATTSPDSPTSTDANAPTSPGAAGEAAEVIKEAGVNVATMIKNMDQLIARGTEIQAEADRIAEKTAADAANATKNQAATLAAETAKANAAPVPGPGDTQGAPKAEGVPEKPPGDATPAPPGEEVKPPGEEVKPPGEEDKPPGEEVKPAKEEKPKEEKPTEEKPKEKKEGGSKSRKGKKSKKSKKGKKAKKNTRKKSKKSNKRA